VTLTDTKAPITTLDRCDKCGAQAMVRATLISGPLYFCGHHARQIAQKLVAQSIEVYDPEAVFNYGKQSL
jgi:hypothetical protein